jgi:hypothetical protein
VAPDGKTSTAAASTQDSDKEDDDANDVVAVATPKGNFTLPHRVLEIYPKLRIPSI